MTPAHTLPDADPATSPLDTAASLATDDLSARARFVNSTPTAEVVEAERAAVLRVEAATEAASRLSWSVLRPVLFAGLPLPTGC